MAKGGRRQGAGRKPKPTEIKLLQGTFRSDRHGDEAQPEQKGFPDAPTHLTPRELEVWGQLQAKCAHWSAPSDWLAFNGVVSLVDRILRNQEAQRATDTAGHPLAFKHVLSDQGEKHIEIVQAEENPLITQEVKLWRELRAYIGITGLSPADRARMRVTTPDEKQANPLDRFIKKSRG
jgi:hypothetical protein